MLLLNFVSAFLSLSTFAYPRQTEILEEIGEDFGFNLEQMRFIPNWNVYGFLLPTNFDATVWWYNGMNGERIGDTESTPVSANKNRIYVSQIKFDCDWRLDLHFCQWEGEYLYEFASFSDSRFNGEYLLMQDDGKGGQRIFPVGGREYQEYSVIFAQ